VKLIRVGVLGCGNVGAPLVSLIERQRTMIEHRKGVRLQVVAVAVRNPAKARGITLR
jgi:homoserine dehydrogenase